MFRKGLGGRRLSVHWCQHSFHEACGGHKSDGLPLVLGFRVTWTRHDGVGSSHLFQKVSFQQYLSKVFSVHLSA